MIATCFLVGLLTIVFLVNLLVIIVTFSNKTTKLCPFCRVYSVSYIGNIMGSFSLYLSDILQRNDGYSDYAEINHQRLDLDQYFFLYMGIGLNMCGIVSFTYVRYKFLKAHERPPDEETTFEIFIKYMLPQIFLTAFIAAVIVFVQHILKTNLLLHSLLILTFFPIVITIGVNLNLTRVLQNRARLGRIYNQSASVKKLRCAQIFILLTTCLQLAYLTFGIIIFVVYIYHKSNLRMMEVLYWVFRVLFFFVFTLEAKMFLHQIPEGRKTIKNALTMCIKTPWNLNTIKTVNNNNNKINGIV